MGISELINSGANVTLAVSVDDLREWHREVIADTKRQLEDVIISEKNESFLSAKQVCDMLSVDASTLWRWEKKNYLVSSKVGGKRRYKMSDVKAILEGGSK